VKLFRYYKAEHALRVLSDLEIRTSIPNTLNDPFELSPNMDASQFTQRWCESLLRCDNMIQKSYQSEGRHRGFTGKKAFKRWYLKDLSHRASELLPVLPGNVERVRKEFADDFSKRYRLVCASRIADSILMWSHYAANHTGVVIQFDTNELPFSEMPDWCMLPVIYSPQKPVYSHFTKSPEFRKAMFAVAASKAAAWSYEQETRIVLPASREILRKARFLRVTPGSITALILGCRLSAATRMSIRSALSLSHFQHVHLMQADLHRAEYALTLRLLNSTQDRAGTRRIKAAAKRGTRSVAGKA
jgi:hypothetical protein